MTAQRALVRRGTDHHHALTFLATQDMEAGELRAFCDSTKPLPRFRTEVLQTLLERRLVQRPDRTLWRITDTGRAELARLGDVIGAANDDSAAPAPGSVFPPTRDGTQPLLAREEDRHLLTSGVVRTAGTAERLPLPIRRGGMDAHQLPSRRGNRLYYRDGRVTDLQGKPISEATR